MPEGRPGHAGIGNVCCGRGFCMTKENETNLVIPFADGSLGDKGHQIIGNPIGVLTDQAAFVGTHRIEVAEQDNRPVRIRFGDIP